MARTKQTARASSEEEEAPIEVPASEVEPVIRHGKGKAPLSSSIVESLLAASRESWSSMEEEEYFGGEDDEEAGFSGREEEFPEEREYNPDTEAGNSAMPEGD